jgi:hypothetical protein
LLRNKKIKAALGGALVKKNRKGPWAGALLSIAET